MACTDFFQRYLYLIFLIILTIINIIIVNISNEHINNNLVWSYWRNLQESMQVYEILKAYNSLFMIKKSVCTLYAT